MGLVASSCTTSMTAGSSTASRRACKLRAKEPALLTSTSRPCIKQRPAQHVACITSPVNWHKGRQAVTRSACGTHTSPINWHKGALRCGHAWTPFFLHQAVTNSACGTHTLPVNRHKGLYDVGMQGSRAFCIKHAYLHSVRVSPIMQDAYSHLQY